MCNNKYTIIVDNLVFINTDLKIKKAMLILHQQQLFASSTKQAVETMDLRPLDHSLIRQLTLLARTGKYSPLLQGRGMLGGAATTTPRVSHECEPVIPCLITSTQTVMTG